MALTFFGARYFAARSLLPLYEGAAASTVIGRRRHSRKYGTPAPTREALEQAFPEIVEAAPAQARKLVGKYLLRGDVIPTQPKPGQVDWDALIQDARTVVKLYDLYLDYVEEEDVIDILLLE